MEQAFILPYPKSARFHDVEKIGGALNQPAKLQLFEKALEAIRKGRLKWEEFLQKFAIADPLIRLAFTKDEDSILHLIALHNRFDLIDLFASDRGLQFRRNRYGLTPLEIAEFLNHEQIIHRLRPRASISFINQPLVTIKAPYEEPLSKLSFLSRPIFERGEHLYEILAASSKAKREDQISSEKIWMGIYFNKEIQEGIHPPVSIRHVSHEIGRGVFAEQRIPSCSYVGEYTGMVLERKPELLRDKTYCVRYSVWEMGRRNFTIDAENGGNFTRFINHSSHPNLSLQSVYWRGLPRMIFVAVKEIPEGTQLSFDYGPIFWKEAGKSPQPLCP